MGVRALLEHLMITTLAKDYGTFAKNLDNFQVQIKAHCNTCLGERNHKILHAEDKDWSDLVDNRYEVQGGDTYRMLECCGCEHVNLQHLSWCSEDIEPDGSSAITVTYFPPAISKVEPAWLNQLALLCIWASYS